MVFLVWEKESIHRPAPVQSFSLQKKKWGPQRKDFGGGYGFLGFYRVFVSTTGLESFSLKPENFSQRFSFGGGCVRFFFSACSFWSKDARVEGSEVHHCQGLVICGFQLRVSRFPVKRPGQLVLDHEQANHALVIVLQSRFIWGSDMLKNDVLEASTNRSRLKPYC